MARIRTIKPEFFRHEGLFEAEKETGLPLRIAFAGLWSCADREGRFRWHPRSLKLDALPYDEVDFSRVLDALLTRGFVVRYALNGEEYGFIPSWKRHQVINNRETASVLPEPSDESVFTTREARVGDASSTRHEHAQGEGKGREGEKEGNKKGKGKSESEPIEIPEPLRTDSFLSAWDDWFSYRRESGLPSWKPVTVKAQLKELSEWGSERSIAAIRTAIRNGWRGIFEQKSNGNGSHQRPARTNLGHSPGSDGGYFDRLEAKH